MNKNTFNAKSSNTITLANQIATGANIGEDPIPFFLRTLFLQGPKTRQDILDYFNEAGQVPDNLDEGIDFLKEQGFIKFEDGTDGETIYISDELMDVVRGINPVTDADKPHQVNKGDETHGLALKDIPDTNAKPQDTDGGRDPQLVRKNLADQVRNGKNMSLALNLLEPKNGEEDFKVSIVRVIIDGGVNGCTLDDIATIDLKGERASQLEQFGVELQEDGVIDKLKTSNGHRYIVTVPFRELIDEARVFLKTKEEKGNKLTDDIGANGRVVEVQHPDHEPTEEEQKAALTRLDDGSENLLEYHQDQYPSGSRTQMFRGNLDAVTEEARQRHDALPRGSEDIDPKVFAGRKDEPYFELGKEKLKPVSVTSQRTADYKGLGNDVQSDKESLRDSGKDQSAEQTHNVRELEEDRRPDPGIDLAKHVPGKITREGIAPAPKDDDAKDDDRYQPHPQRTPSRRDKDRYSSPIPNASLESHAAMRRRANPQEEREPLFPKDSKQEVGNGGESDQFKADPLVLNIEVHAFGKMIGLGDVIKLAEAAAHLLRLEEMSPGAAASINMFGIYMDAEKAKQFLANAKYQLRDL